MAQNSEVHARLTETCKKAMCHGVNPLAASVLQSTAKSAISQVQLASKQPEVDLGGPTGP